MLCTIIIASFLHGRKLSAKDNDIDRLATTLSGIKAYVKPGTHILIENSTSKGELPFQSRYLLAPAIIDLNGTHDTILLITEKNSPKPIDSTRRQLWSNTDSLYHYNLTCSY